MKRLSIPAAAAVAMSLLLGACTDNQQSRGAIEKKHSNYSEWTKGLFAEAVTVTGFGRGRLIYLGGIGAEEEQGKPGDIRAPKNFAGQCEYSFQKIERVLQRNNATLKDIVKMTSYLTDANNIGPYVGCRNKYFTAAQASLPAETLVIINRLAWPDMLLEVDVNALAAN